MHALNIYIKKYLRQIYHKWRIKGHKGGKMELILHCNS